jgi:hypothetical protein
MSFLIDRPNVLFVTQTPTGWEIEFFWLLLCRGVTTKVESTLTEERHSKESRCPPKVSKTLCTRTRNSKMLK